MLYVIISDILGNATALEAVMEDIKHLKYFHLYCLGDAVGLGPEPEKCIEILCEETNFWIGGDRDLIVAGVLSILYGPAADQLSSLGKEALEWNRDHISEDNLTTLSELAIEYISGPYLFSHACPVNPMDFNPVRTLSDVKKIFDNTGQQIICTGHSQLTTAISRKEGTTRLSAITNKSFPIHPDFRYYINVGSVDCTQNRKPEASYVVIDEDKSEITFHRVPYNMEVTRNKIAATGLPTELNL